MKPLYFLIAASIIFSLLLMGGYLLPDAAKAKAEATVFASQQSVFKYLNDLKNWEGMAPPFKSQDPTLKYTYSNNAVGIGAVQHREGDKTGKSSITLREVYPPQELNYQIKLMDNKLAIKGKIRIEAIDGQQSKIEWLVNANLGNNPAFRYFGLLMDDMMQTELDTTISRLKRAIE